MKVDGKEFIEVCGVEDIEENLGRKFVFPDEREAAVFRIGDEFFAISNVCPHKQIGKMHKAFVRGKTATCPIHGWKYSLVNGKNLRAGGNIETFETAVREGKVFIENKPQKKPSWMDFDF